MTFHETQPVGPADILDKERQEVYLSESWVSYQITAHINVTGTRKLTLNCKRRNFERIRDAKNKQFHNRNTWKSILQKWTLQ